MIEVRGYRSLKCFCAPLLLLLLNGAFASSYADDVVSFYRNRGAVCGSGKVYQGYILKVNSGQDLRLAQADILDDLPDERATGKTTGTVEDTINAVEGKSTDTKVLVPLYIEYATGFTAGSGGNTEGKLGGYNDGGHGDFGGDTGGNSGDDADGDAGGDAGGDSGGDADGDAGGDDGGGGKGGGKGEGKGGGKGKGSK